jgi:peptidoglycan hydrolase CwlO-like protein
VSPTNCEKENARLREKQKTLESKILDLQNKVLKLQNKALKLEQKNLELKTEIAKVRGAPVSFTEVDLHKSNR